MKSIVYFKILLADGLPKIMEIMIQTMASKVAFGGLLDDRPRTTDDGELRCPGKMKSIVYFKILLAGWLPKIKEIMIQTMAGKVAFGGFLLMGVFTLSLVAALNN